MSGSNLGITFETAYCHGLNKYFNYSCVELSNPTLIFWLINSLIVIVFAILAFVLIKIWRNRRLELAQKALMSIIGLLVIFVLIDMVFWNLNSTTYREVSNMWEKYNKEQQTKQVEIPVNIKKQADDIIIERVGEKIFNEDIKYNARRTKEVNIPKVFGNLTHQEYRIVYNYITLEILNGTQEDTFFTVTITDPNSPYYEQHKAKRTGILNNHLPNCAEEPKLCEFQLTAKDAIQIAKNNGFDADDLKVQWFSWGQPTLTIKLSSCSLNKVMLLDYTDSSVIEFKDEVICGGGF